MATKQKRSLLRFGENPENPFEGDRLGRDTLIKHQTRRITKVISSPAVVALDAQWGAGKTAFAKMWAAHLNNEGVPALYFDAWRADFAKDPLVSFKEQMDRQLSQATGEKTRKILTAIKKEAPKIIKPLIGVSMDAANVYAPGASAFKKPVFAVAGNMWNRFFKQPSTEESLKKFINLSSAQRVVVFVDELDRCRPDFAVRILERIEHLFAIPGLIFVLGMNREQLCASIKGLYGSEFDAKEYLKRFINTDCVLEKPAGTAYWKVLMEEAEIIADSHARGRDNIYSSMLFTFQLMQQIYDISLRDAEHIMLRINLAMSSISKDSGVFPEFLAFLVATREKNRSKFLRYIAPSTGMAEVVADWEKQLERTSVYGNSAEMMAASGVTACLVVAKHNNDGTIKKMHDHYKARQEQTHVSDGEKEYAGFVADSIRFFARSENTDLLNYIVRKIELQDDIHLEDDGAQGGRG